MPEDDASEDGWETAATARRRAYHLSLAPTIRFDPTKDRASLIAAFFEAKGDRFHEAHHDPVLGPIIRQSVERYDGLRRYDFDFAKRVAMIEAVRIILALPEVDLVPGKGAQSSPDLPALGAPAVTD